VPRTATAADAGLAPTAAAAATVPRVTATAARNRVFMGLMPFDREDDHWSGPATSDGIVGSRCDWLMGDV
jgi:hypothetical protein